jgi:hypothetical protein
MGKENTDVRHVIDLHRENPDDYALKLFWGFSEREADFRIFPKKMKQGGSSNPEGIEMHTSPSTGYGHDK